MKHFTHIAMAFGALCLLGLGGAQAADNWDIDHEEKARFEAKVVDVLCELSGDCPANCGGGKRQFGLLKDDGTLILAVKNADPFAGTAVDLVQFCGKRIIADGLLIKNPKMPLFALQFKKLAPDGKWSRANWFTKEWAKRNGAAPGSKKANSWFRSDPTVKALIKKDGVFGIPGIKPEE